MMPSLRLLGRVEPLWYALNFDLKPEFKHRIEEIDVELTCTVEIDKSLVTAHCEISKRQPEYLSWILPYVYDFVSSGVDLACFAWGKGFQVLLDRAELPNGQQSYLVNDAPDLAALATAFKLTGDAGSMRVELKDVMSIVWSSPALMFAMRDLSAALRFGNNTLINCGRAVEGIRKSLWGKDEAKDEMQASWERLRTTLNVSEEYLKVITAASIYPRHGSSAYIHSAVRQDVLARAWTLMNRLLVFHLHGGMPLSVSAYPMLN